MNPYRISALAQQASNARQPAVGAHTAPPVRVPPSSGFPAGTVTLAVYRLLPGGGPGGAWEHVGRVQVDDEGAKKALVTRLPAGRYRIACCGANGKVVRGGQCVYEKAATPGAGMRPVRARVPRDYRATRGASTPTTTQFTALEAEVLELQRRLALSRKRRLRLLELVAQLDQEADRLMTHGRACGSVLDYVEHVTQTRYKRPVTANFTRRVALPENVHAELAERAAKAQRPPP